MMVLREPNLPQWCIIIRDEVGRKLDEETYRRWRDRLKSGFYNLTEDEIESALNWTFDRASKELESKDINLQWLRKVIRNYRARSDERSPDDGESWREHLDEQETFEEMWEVMCDAYRAAPGLAYELESYAQKKYGFVRPQIELDSLNNGIGWEGDND